MELKIKIGNNTPELMCNIDGYCDASKVYPKALKWNETTECKIVGYNEMARFGIMCPDINSTLVRS